ncbi:MAG: MarR family transcriptional regulator [Pseudonocardia sp.]
MSTLSVTSAARKLSPEPTSSGTVRGANDDVQHPGRELDIATRVTNLRRSHIQVLAALARSPMGRRSARAVARAGGLSPTAGIRAVRDLFDLGLVERRHETFAEGTVTTAEILYANLMHPQWPELAPRLAQVRRPRAPRAASRRIPARLAHVFWNVPVRDIDVTEHGPFIARRVLLEGDTQALAWAAETLTAENWRAAAQGRGIDARRRALAENLAAASA